MHKIAVKVCLTFVFGAVLSAFFACATPVAGLKSDPSFTYESVISGKIAIGGVGAYSGLDETAAAQYSSLLKTMLQDERSAYEIAPPGVLKGQLGDEPYAAMMKSFSTTGSLDQAGLDALASFKGSRYVAFCIIESDAVAKDRVLTDQKDKKGNKIAGSDRIVKSAKRTVTASLSVYDATTQKRVWSGSVSKMKDASQEFTPEEKNLLVDLVKAANKTEEANDDQKYPPPPPPGTEQVIGEVFRGFAQNMPKS